ncbi:hypothetical protein RJ640_022855 [Escallonia rubra]|uniref:Uncharacterized protein n=1 Tax=Escallonia rubra TaxID=112253 RepID=A0AA88U9V9_9ASTE|nr:hypothetical protein RJ640_022855 [Escallonia rubra]
MVSSYSFKQSAHATFSFSLRHLGPRPLVCPSALRALSMAICTAIFRNSDFCFGAKWRGPWFMKYLHGSGYGVWLHHQFTSLLDMAGERKKGKDTHIIKNPSFIAIVKLALYLDNSRFGMAMKLARDFEGPTVWAYLEFTGDEPYSIFPDQV